MPWLAEPRFDAVARALERGDEREAARAAAATCDQARGEKRAPAELRSLALLAARFLERAGDPLEALARYDQAAADDWALSSYGRLGAARCLAALGRPAEALDRLGRIPGEGPVAVQAEELRAEVLVLSGSRAPAIAAFRRTLASSDAAVRDRAALRLATLLLEEPAAGARDPADVIEALGLARRVSLVGAANDPRAIEARTLEQRALERLPESDRKTLARPSAPEALSAVTALVEARRFEEANVAINSLRAGGGHASGSSSRDTGSSEAWCGLELLRGRTLAGLRQWGAASDLLGEVSRRCSDPDLVTRALFLAGKHAESDKRFAQAIRYYEQIEKEHGKHRLADDARFRAALCYAELGAEARFSDLITRMPDDYPEGDMVLDALFEVAARRLGKGDWAGAGLALDRAATLPAAISADRGQEYRGREPYFRARAWGIEGQTEKSLSELERVISEAPLSYYMLQAYTRLSVVDGSRAERALQAALASGKNGTFGIAPRPEQSRPGFARAMELLRISDVEDAERELDAVGLRGPDVPSELAWAAAFLYTKAGSARLSQQLVQGMPRDWLRLWPAGDFRKPWEIAYPRPYRNLVQRAAEKNKIPEFLVYAIMREESSFDPDAESPARAYGLMQLIEPTARQYGRPLGMSPDRVSLKRPEVNVAIGCRVLSDLESKFPTNPLLAIPGYNAGPTASRRWMEARPDADFDVWVELIPYGETRRYTKRVLASRATYAFLYDPEHAQAALKLPLRISGAPP